MHAQVKAAHRRKALTPDGLPFGVLAMDGKSVTTDSWDGKYGQRHRHSEDQEAVGLIRTMTCALVSSKVKVCVDAIPIRASTNEMGQFRASLNALVQAYGRLGLFQLISYDAGGCSEENADAIIEKKLDYLFAIKDSQPGIRAELERLLGQRPTEKAEATTVDTLSNRKTVTRRLYLIAKQPLYRWSHARTFLRVESETLESGRVTAYENRYFICSLESTRLTMDQWLLVVRRHWNVENQCHHTWDTAFEEDAHPWMRSHPRAIVVLKLLRRMAYNLLALFRGMTQRSDERRQTPWKTIIRWTRNALIAATEVQLRRLLPEGNAVRS